jgi:hypothetical protein
MMLTSIVFAPRTGPAAFLTKPQTILQGKLRMCGSFGSESVTVSVTVRVVTARTVARAKMVHK